MVKQAQNWIAAVEMLAGDAEARVTCPNCAQAILVTSDEHNATHGRTQRNFECPACGERGSVLLGGDNGFSENGAAPETDSTAENTAGRLRRLVVATLRSLTGRK